jgi:Xaa-Pro aminopeptidase
MKQSFQKATKSSKVKKSEEALKVMMSELRQIKLHEELVLMQKAIDITLSAQIALMKSLEDGMTEYQTEAIIEYVFKKEGAEYPGFPSIQGGGENSCVLHYVSNRKQLSNEHLLVSDVGAEYRGYTADVTRTLPVDGKFSEEEKAIYNLVLKAQNAGIRACIAGNTFRSTHEATTEIITAGLLKLGIIKEKREVRKFFMHGTSHYLGLDVHDWGTYENLEAGNVITVEPGIYIAEGSDCDPKWWNIGVRIEDDILITDGEPINLSEAAPRTIEAIEKIMKMEAEF